MFSCITNVFKEIGIKDISFNIDESKKRLSFCCSIDNLLKGAASQAIQNLNNAMNFDEELGL